MQARQLSPGNYTIKDGYIAALTKEDLDEAIGYVTRGDEAAFNRMVAQGRVIYLKAGLPVYLEGCEGLICSTVKIRPQGYTTTIYTVAEAIE